MTTLANIQLQQVVNELENLLFNELVTVYNDMADAFSYDRIYDNDEHTLNEIFSTPYDAIRQTNHDGYNDNDDYFTFNGYGNLVSFSYHPTEDGSPISLSELAQWLIDEDKLSDYDIDVTTLDDMLASIEDNITDDENLLNMAIDYLGLENDKDSSYDEKVFDVMYELNKGDYIDAQNTMRRLGINYE